MITTINWLNRISDIIDTDYRQQNLSRKGNARDEQQLINKHNWEPTRKKQAYVSNGCYSQPNNRHKICLQI